MSDPIAYPVFALSSIPYLLRHERGYATITRDDAIAFVSHFIPEDVTDETIARHVDGWASEATPRSNADRRAAAHARFVARQRLAY